MFTTKTQGHCPRCNEQVFEYSTEHLKEGTFCVIKCCKCGKFTMFPLKMFHEINDEDLVWVG